MDDHAQASPSEDRFRYFETDDGFGYLHRRGDRVSWLDYGGGMWLIAGYRELVEALADDDTYSSEHDFPNGSTDRLGVMTPPTPMRAVPIELDPPRYQAYRKLISPRFSPARVRELKPQIQQYTRWCLARHCESGSMDLFNDLIKLVPAMVTLGLIGLPVGDAEIIADAIHRRGDDRFALSPAWALLAKHLYETIAARRADPADDLISYLLQAQIDGESLTEQQIVEICFTVVVGGMSTTAKLTLGALSYFGVHPDERAAIAADLELLPAAMEEFLRYYSPVSILARTATRDVCIAGQQIATGQRVGMGFAAANRDPEVFQCPDRLQLDRNPNRHLAFGHGVHFCVGSNLGRLEASVMVEEVLRTIGDYTLSEEFYLVEDLSSSAAFGQLRKVSWGERLERGLRVGFTPAPAPESGLVLNLDSLPPVSDVLTRLAQHAPIPAPAS